MLGLRETTQRQIEAQVGATRQDGLTPYVVGVFLTQRSVELSVEHRVLLVPGERGLQLPSVPIPDGKTALEGLHLLREHVGLAPKDWMPDTAYGLYDHAQPTYAPHVVDASEELTGFQHPLCALVMDTAVEQSNLATGAQWQSLPSARATLEAHGDPLIASQHPEMLGRLNALPAIWPVGT
jgi:hypothetical protein